MRPDIFNVKRALEVTLEQNYPHFTQEAAESLMREVLAQYRLYRESLPPYIIHRLKPLVPRYEAITRLIFESIRDYGRAPSIQEMVEGTNITSTSVVNYYLARLVVFKIIEKDKGVSRGLRIAEC